jgi:hypothetical protein
MVEKRECVEFDVVAVALGRRKVREHGLRGEQVWVH